MVRKTKEINFRGINVWKFSMCLFDKLNEEKNLVKLNMQTFARKCIVDVSLLPTFSSGLFSRKKEVIRQERLDVCVHF